MKAPSTFYQDVIKGGYDVRSGIYAALDDSITMELDRYGEYRYVEQEGLKNPKLARISAMSDESLNEDKIAKKLFGTIPGVKHVETIGYYLENYAGHVTTEDYREKASSGGFCTWLLVELLNRDLIDGVIHVRESSDPDGILFKYAISTTEEEIRAGSKSRYYPTEFSGPIHEIRNMPGRYAVVGIPSFIMEIRLLADTDPFWAEKIAYTFGLICGHQKSAKYAEALAWQHGIKPGDLRKIDFRKKIQGQPADRYNTEFTGLIDGKEITFVKDQTELYVSNWGHGFFKSKLSDFTDDALNETADISLGDAWLPQYTSDSGGNNILIVRNQDILNIIKDGLENNVIKLDLISPDTVIASQLGLIHHTRNELPYRLYKKDARKLWRPEKRLDASHTLPFFRKRIQDIREIISTSSHIKYKEAVEANSWEYFLQHTKRYTVLYSISYRLMHARNVQKRLMQRIFQ